MLHGVAWTLGQLRGMYPATGSDNAPCAGYAALAAVV